jgi:uncharacterized protein YsxB (DUF464 family)
VTTGLTGANDFSINGHAAFKTNAHTANAASVSTTHTEPLSVLPVVQKDHKQTNALFDFLRLSVDQDLLHVAGNNRSGK